MRSFVYIAGILGALGMKKWIGILSILLMGCRANWVVRPTPAEPIHMQEAVVANGTLNPQGISFMLITQYWDDEARVIVLTEPALKLADLTVSSNQIQLHEKAPRVPNRLVYAWGKLAQQQFLTSCPAREIKQPAQGISGTFELEVTGGLCL